MQVLGDETLRAIARDLVETVRGNVNIDCTVKESGRASLRRAARRGAGAAAALVSAE